MSERRRVLAAPRRDSFSASSTGVRRRRSLEPRACRRCSSRRDLDVADSASSMHRIVTRDRRLHRDRLRQARSPNRHRAAARQPDDDRLIPVDGDARRRSGPSPSTTTAQRADRAHATVACSPRPATPVRQRPADRLRVLETPRLAPRRCRRSIDMDVRARSHGDRPSRSCAHERCVDRARTARPARSRAALTRNIDGLSMQIAHAASATVATDGVLEPIGTVDRDATSSSARSCTCSRRPWAGRATSPSAASRSAWRRARRRRGAQRAEPPKPLGLDEYLKRRGAR